MPLYFFDSQDDEVHHRDAAGLPFVDDDGARREGLRAMADLARDYLPSFGPAKSLAVTVRSGKRVVLELVMTLTVRTPG